MISIVYLQYEVILNNAWEMPLFDNPYIKVTN